MNSTKTASPRELRQFGLVVGGIFIAFFGLLRPWIVGSTWPVWPWVLGAPLILFGAVFPRALRYPHKGWMVLGHVLGYINTRLILGLLFVIAFIPTAMFVRLKRMDLLKLKFDPNLSTYRQTRQAPDWTTSSERPF